MQSVSHLAGSSKGFRDGSATNAKFHSPWGLAVYTASDGKKLALVSDYYNYRIRSVNVLSGWTSTVLGGNGYGDVDGSPSVQKVKSVASVKVAPNNQFLLFSDKRSCKVKKRSMSSGDVTTLAAHPDVIYPIGIAITSDSKVAYVADTGLNAIKVINMAVNPPTVSTLVGNRYRGYRDGVGSNVKFNGLESVALSPDEQYLYTTEYKNNVIRRISISSRTSITWAGRAGRFGGNDGAGTSAQFNGLGEIAFHPSGSYFLVPDYYGHKLRKVVMSNRVVTTVAGSGTRGYYNNVDGSRARFDGPCGAAFVDDNEAIVADFDGNKIRHITMTSVPTSAPTPASGVTPAPTSHCSNPNVKTYGYDFTFADGTVLSGFSDANTVDVTVDGKEFELHISCSDTYENGYGEKGGPVEGVNPRVTEWHIRKFDNPGDSDCEVKKECSGVYDPPTTPITPGQCDDPNAKDYHYNFTFADGTHLTGFSDANTVDVTVDGKEFELHISCSDTYENGYGEKGGPVEGVNPRVTNWHIRKFEDPGDSDCEVKKECSGVYTTPTTPEQCSNPNVKTYGYDFTFEDGTVLTGFSDSNTVDVTVDGKEFELHISCSDNFENGYGEKGGPIAGENPRVTEWHIRKFDNAGEVDCDLNKECSGTFTPPVTPDACDDPNVKDYGYDFTFADGTVLSGFSDSNTVDVTVDGKEFELHISCSDMFEDGFGEKGGPVEGVNPHVTEFRIRKFDNAGESDCEVKKECSGVYSATPTTNQCDDPNVKKYSYDFTFADGTILTGFSSSNTVDVNVDGKEMELHISCSDKFEDGFGEKGGPIEGVNPRVTDFHIRKYKYPGNSNCRLDKECSDMYPTAHPTKAPTSSPTKNPTRNPTAHPTKNPTRNPTAHPTRDPTRSPTPHPTAEPTKSPTSKPTPAPSPAPTHRPSSNPTKSPTPVPSASPTKVPSTSPTLQPTPDPTGVPTSEPTKSPVTSAPSAPTGTQSPTAAPTARPSRNPTTAPTPVPTRTPTVVPTSAPTPVPTVTPSAVPTSVPTASPSSVPTAVPSVGPTAVPTTVPSASPTPEPTEGPTFSPTVSPTPVPTSVPTTKPTSDPTVAPTLSPTPVPTTTPTVQPSASFAPSLAPTNDDCRNPAVMIRLDNVEAYWCNELVVELVEEITSLGYPVNLGLIGGGNGEPLSSDTYISEHLEEWALNPLIEFSSGSHYFTSFKGEPLEWQISDLEMANAEIKEAADVTTSPTSFIPPYGNFDGNTVTAMKSENMDVLSSYCIWDPANVGTTIWCPSGSTLAAPNIDQDGVCMLPVGAVLGGREYWEDNSGPADLFSAVSWIEAQISQQGFSVLQLNPLEFALDKRSCDAMDIDKKQVLKEVLAYGTGHWDFLTFGTAKTTITTPQSASCPTPPPRTPLTASPTAADTDTDAPSLSPVAASANPTPSPTTKFTGTPTQPECNPLPVAMFRMDNVEAFWCTDIASQIVDIFLEEGIALNVGLIGQVDGHSSLSEDTILADKIHNWKQSWLIEVASQSMSYKDFEAETLAWQTADILAAQDEIMSVADGYCPMTFIPPYGGFDHNTPTAMQSSHLDVMSSFCIWDPENEGTAIWCPSGSHLVAPNIKYDGTDVYMLPAGAVLGGMDYWADNSLPASLSSSMEYMDAQVANQGFSVLSLNPMEFALDRSTCLGLDTEKVKVLREVFAYARLNCNVQLFQDAKVIISSPPDCSKTPTTAPTPQPTPVPTTASIPTVAPSMAPTSTTPEPTTVPTWDEECPGDVQTTYETTTKDIKGGKSTTTVTKTTTTLPNKVITAYHESCTKMWTETNFTDGSSSDTSSNSNSSNTLGGKLTYGWLCALIFGCTTVILLAFILTQNMRKDKDWNDDNNQAGAQAKSKSFVDYPQGMGDKQSDGGDSDGGSVVSYENPNRSQSPQRRMSPVPAVLSGNLK